MMDLRRSVDDLINDPAVPGQPAAPEPPTSAATWVERVQLWVGALEAATPEQRERMRPEDREALAAGQESLDAERELTAADLAALQEAWSRLHRDGAVTTEQALSVYSEITERVCCPACGRYQVYDLAPRCAACGGERWEAVDPVTGKVVSRITVETEVEIAGLVEQHTEVVELDGYDVRARFRCADPACLQYASTCSKCSGKVATDAWACLGCGAPWPRSRTRWATAPRGECGGADGSSAAFGCGWKKA